MCHMYCYAKGNILDNLFRAVFWSKKIQIGRQTTSDVKKHEINGLFPR
jgi:hypothetical protein